MALLRAQVIIKPVSGLAADSSVNTFHFSTADVTASTLDGIQAALKAFYDVGDGVTPGVFGWYASNMSPNGVALKIVNLDDPMPRTPIRDVVFNFAIGAGSLPLPSEVALVGSFQGAKESGLKQARRRGRVFVGPLGVDGNSGGRPALGLRNTLKGAMSRLEVASTAAPFWSWIVLSEAFAGRPAVPGGLPARPAYPRTFALVTNGWVDDAWDTQRRRGVKPTIKTLWP